MNTYKCPMCGNEDVRVHPPVSCLPTEDGVEVRGEIIPEGQDFANCCLCEWSGKFHHLVLSPAYPQD
jgi:hypothetical protein